jgi:hypothetical protein
MLPTIETRSRLETLYEAILFTFVRLKSDPRLQGYVPIFEQLLAEWWDVYKAERGILDEGVTADAAVSCADQALDRTSDGVAGTILIDVGNNRRSPLYLRYFPSESPSRFKKPKLSEQLAAMRTWPPSLLDSPNPALKAYGAALVAQIDAADEAVARVSTADQKLADFRTTGARKQFFDKVNGARKKLHGEVAKLVHDHPEWNLPKGYVNALFQHEATPELSLADVDRKIEAASAELAKLYTMREARLKEEEEAAMARKEAEKKAQQAELEAAAKAAAEAKARFDALQAKLASANA